MNDGAPIKIVAGLGNPGSKYIDTRHNVGFLLIDELLNSVPAQDRSDWRKDEDTIYVTLKFGATKLLLVKPQTFMNLSGKPISRLINYYKVSPKDLLVCHDDIDLPLGRLRIRFGGGAGGHNGISSIISEVGTADFVRIKIGVGRPQSKDPSPEAKRGDGGIVDWVLGKFSFDEKQILDKVFVKAVDALKEVVSVGVTEAQAKFNNTNEESR